MSADPLSIPGAFQQTSLDADHDIEDRTTPLLSLHRFRIRLVQLCVVLILCGVTYSAVSDYSRRFENGVSNLAAERGVDVSSGWKNFFVFAVTISLAASLFNLCAILAVRYTHPTKTPKHRVFAELGTDLVAIVCLLPGTTLLLNPAAVGGDPGDLVTNSDLRNVACVLAKDSHFADPPPGAYVDYPAICGKLWSGIVFGYIALVTFLVALFPSIERARLVLSRRRRV